MRMLLQDYQAIWPEQFRQIAEILQLALQDYVHRIEHIGSTAIPGLAAKPIIDIDIIYPLNTELAQIKSALASLGYFHNGNQGIPNREAFKRLPDQQHPVLDQIRHHLYACPEDSLELKRHLLFRDYLRNTASARDAYQTLKFQIAASVDQDRKLYAQLKEQQARPMIETFLNLAQQTK